MPTAAEILAMVERLEDNIRAEGWDAAIEGAIKALDWASGNAFDDYEAYFGWLMERPAAERRREWIARGGNPRDWPMQDKGGS